MSCTTKIFYYKGALTHFTYESDDTTIKRQDWAIPLMPDTTVILNDNTVLIEYQDKYATVYPTSSIYVGDPFASSVQETISDIQDLYETILGWIGGQVESFVLTTTGIQLSSFAADNVFIYWDAADLEANNLELTIIGAGSLIISPNETVPRRLNFSNKIVSGINITTIPSGSVYVCFGSNAMF